MVTEEMIELLLQSQDAELLDESAEPSLPIAALIVTTAGDELWASAQVLLASPDPRRRILGTRLAREATPFQAEAAEVLGALLASESNQDVIWWLVRAFGFLNSESVTNLLPALARDESARIRYNVATALANCAELRPASLDALTELARDDDAEVRFSAVYELGAWWGLDHDPHVRGTLERALSDSAPFVAKAAADALEN